MNAMNRVRSYRKAKQAVEELSHDLSASERRSFYNRISYYERKTSKVFELDSFTACWIVNTSYWRTKLSRAEYKKLIPNSLSVS